MERKIEAILEKIRPALNYDGGDIELVKVEQKAGRIHVRFTGACDHCAISEITLRHLIERELRKEIPQITSVIAVS